MFKRILVPLDGSQRAEQAIAIAMQLAKASGASLLLLEAINPTHSFALSPARSAAYLQKLQGKRQIEATAYLAKLAHSLEGEGFETHIAVLSGQPAPTILNVIQEQEIDLVVLNSHGHTGFQRWALGSVSQKVLRQCPVPVLLLREQKIEHAERFPHPFRATIALDGSPFAEAALLPAVFVVTALNQPGEGELHLLQFVEMPTIEEEFGYLLDSDFNFRHAALQEASHYLQALHARLLHELPATAGLHISWSVEECQDVADALIQIAEHGQGVGSHKVSQLIALATHGRSGLHRLILGSVTERVLLGSTLPLLIIHPPKTACLQNKEENEMAQTDASREPDWPKNEAEFV